MNFFTEIYHTFLYDPLFNALIYLYDSIPVESMGLAIITLTLIIRFILFPFSKKSIESQRALQKLNPMMSEIREKYKDDKEKQSQELMKLYSEHKVSPLSSCLPLLVQLPIIYTLYRVFQGGLTTDNFDVLYSFVGRPETIDSIFLGFIDLAEPKNILLAIIAGALQFVQSWMLLQKTKKKKAEEKKDDKPKSKEDQMAEATQKLSRNMTYFFPLITIWFGYSLPAGLSLYWIVTTLFAIAQQYLLQRKEGEDEEKEGETKAS